MIKKDDFLKAGIVAGYVFFSTLASYFAGKGGFSEWRTALVVAGINAGLAFFSYLAKVAGVVAEVVRRIKGVER